MLSRSAAARVWVMAVALPACSAAGSVDPSPAAQAGGAAGAAGTSFVASGGGGSGAGAGGSSDGAGGTLLVVPPGGGTPGAGSGTPEVCNGLDDDGDGIVDDVDVNGDGICDCLRIATLGASGTAGQGNVFGTWLSTRSQNGAVNLGSQVLTSALLAPFQVLVVQDVSGIGRAYAPGEIQALGDWVRAGGGLMTLIGYGDASEVVNVNSLLASFGEQYGTANVMQGTGLGIPGLSPRVSTPVTEWQPHPVSVGVTQLGMDNGKPVLGSGTTIATGQGNVLCQGAQAGAGRVLLWGDEWITFDSEWSTRPEYQVELFWINAILWLSPPKQCQVKVPPRLLQ